MKQRVWLSLGCALLMVLRCVVLADFMFTQINIVGFAIAFGMTLVGALCWLSPLSRKQ